MPEIPQFEYFLPPHVPTCKAEAPLWTKTPFRQPKDADVLVCDMVLHLDHVKAPEAIQRLLDLGWRFEATADKP